MKNSNSLMNFLPLPAAAGSHRVRPTAPRRNLFTRLCRIGLAAGLLLTGITAGRADSTLPSGLCADGKKTTEGVDWRQFLSRHDLQWDTLTADPVKRSMDNHLRTGYYDGAIMGNGLIGTNLYKLEKNTYRLNVGRSDVTEARSPYSLFNSARLPIGYFTLRTCGEVNGEQMRLSIYDAITRGTFTTTRGALHFQTYVHARRDIIVFETEAEGGETGFTWDFVPQQAISPRYCMNGTAPDDYLNHRKESNPRPVRKEADGLQLLVQPLATDTTFRHIARVYAVAWKEVRQGNRRRIVATVAQEKDEATHRPYTSRYIGSLVADYHRNMLKGGIYIYPETGSHPTGKLRLLYECNPIAFIAEQSGALAVDGEQRSYGYVYIARIRASARFGYAESPL